MLRQLNSYCEPWQLILQMQPRPLCFMGGSGRYAILGLNIREVSEREVFSQRLADAQSGSGLPFECGYVGLLSYDQFAKHGGTPSRFFYLAGAVVFDQYQKQMWLTGTDTAAVDERVIECARTLRAEKLTPLNVIPIDSEVTYMTNVEHVIQEIHVGRFYQLNMLRYFHLRQEISAAQICARLNAFGGPFSAWLQVDDLEVISFSPERFVIANTAGKAGQIATFPIKGTRPRSCNAEVDTLLANTLMQSRKDRAELNMIIDLMRNDLQQVCSARTVKVHDAGSLSSFQHVHHLVGHVSGYLKSEVTLGDVFKAVCPGGSITGAPKVEVMKAIAQYEQRPRGYFMGNLFSFDKTSRRLDSSILIRTLVRRAENSYEFAAGSGIVVKSNAAAELAEINDKCRVITNH